MYNRQLTTILVNSYSGVDEYGDMLTTLDGSRTIQGSINIHSQSTTDDIRYQNAEYLILTKDKNISDQDRLLFNNQEYKVLYVNPFGRLNQVWVSK